MYRHAAVAALLVAVTLPAPTHSHDGHTDIIDGRLNPERLPEESVWDNIFAAVHDMTAGKTDARDPDVQAFIRGNLYLSEVDAATLLRHVSAERARVERMEHRLRVASAEGATPEERARLREEIGRATLQARDELLRSLSPRGNKALLRWVALAKRGMKHGPDRAELGVSR